MVKSEREAHHMTARSGLADFLKSQPFERGHKPHEAIARRFGVDGSRLENRATALLRISDGGLDQLIAEALAAIFAMHVHAGQRPDLLLGLSLRSAEIAIGLAWRDRDPC